MSPDSIASLVRVLDSRAEVLEAYVFGSVARGDTHGTSDIDVAVYIDPKLSPDAPYGYPADLATAIGSALGRSDVDVVVLNEAPPLLYHRVISQGERLLSRNLRATTTREGYALSRYCDYLPQQRIVDEALAARIASGRFGR
jgi:hypothetical protein